MKIKSVLLFVILTFISSQSFAQEGLTGFEPQLKTKKTDSREEIKPFNFSKLFSDAETQFKAAKAWKKIECKPKSGFLCTKHECVKRDIKATLTLDKTKKLITRCEGKACETFDAEFEQTGVFVNVQTKGPVGTLIRILGDYRYKEITTVGLDAYIANGECLVIGDEKGE
jgi:hypothetical protein